MASLIVLWRILYFFVVPKLFLCADAVNDETNIVFSPCGVLSMNLFLMIVCVSNVHHLFQFPEFFVAVALAILLVVSRMLLVKVSRKQYL